MPLKTQLDTILDKKLSRKEFLGAVALGVVALTGFNTARRMLAAPQQSIDGGYGEFQTVTTLTGAAIQAAMNSFGGNPGIVALKPGAVYQQTSPADQLILPNNITLLMNGATLKMNTPTGVGLTQIVNADNTNGNSNIAIIGPGVIDGNYQNTGKDASVNATMELHKCGKLTIENIEVKNCFRYGIILFGDQAAQARYVNLTNLVIHDCKLGGIWVANGQRAVNWTNVIVHDCGGDSGLQNAAAVVDSSEQIVNGLYAYGNTGAGIYIRNVFVCTLNNLVATQNGQHGIYVVALTDSVGANWLSTNNGDSAADFSDIYFEGTGRPTWGYDTTAGVVITGIRCGPLAGSSLGTNWKPPHTGSGQEAYALYFEDLIGSFGGDVRLLNVEATAGRRGAIRYPATLGNLVVSTGREGWDGAPSTATVIATSTPKNTTGFVTSGFFDGMFFNALRQNAGTQNDFVEWDVAIGAGEWKLDVFHLAATNCGIYTVTVDGASIGTVDGYNSVNNTPEQAAIGPFTVAMPGRHTIRFAMLTKNAGATAYRGQLSGFTLTRTGA